MSEFDEVGDERDSSSGEVGDGKPEVVQERVLFLIPALLKVQRSVCVCQAAVFL